jgi:hypothetical protein
MKITMMSLQEAKTPMTSLPSQLESDDQTNINTGANAICISGIGAWTRDPRSYDGQKVTILIRSNA